MSSDLIGFIVFIITVPLTVRDMNWIVSIYALPDRAMVCRPHRKVNGTVMSFYDSALLPEGSFYLLLSDHKERRYVHNEKHNGNRGASGDTSDFPGFGIVLPFANCLHKITNLISWRQLIIWVSMTIIYTCRDD